MRQRDEPVLVLSRRRASEAGKLHSNVVVAMLSVAMPSVAPLTGIERTERVWTKGIGWFEAPCVREGVQPIVVLRV